jgi:hypothetical protein
MNIILFSGPGHQVKKRKKVNLGTDPPPPLHQMKNHTSQEKIHINERNQNQVLIARSRQSIRRVPSHENTVVTGNVTTATTNNKIATVTKFNVL